MSTLQLPARLRDGLHRAPRNAPPLLHGCHPCEIAPTTAALVVFVSTRGLPTRYWCDTVPAGCYDAQPIAEIERHASLVRLSLHYLRPATTHHYALFARNAAGVAGGMFGAFTTLDPTT